jgi:hypothetical protein
VNRTGRATGLLVCDRRRVEQSAAVVRGADQRGRRTGRWAMEFLASAAAGFTPLAAPIRYRFARVSALAVARDVIEPESAGALHGDVAGLIGSYLSGTSGRGVHLSVTAPHGPMYVVTDTSVAGRWAVTGVTTDLLRAVVLDTLHDTGQVLTRMSAATGAMRSVCASDLTVCTAPYTPNARDCGAQPIPALKCRVGPLNSTGFVLPLPPYSVHWRRASR